MIVENVVEVLRYPKQPNAIYHAECYEWDGKELVLHVLRLIRDTHCAECKGMVSKMPANIQQLRLFDEVA